MTQINPVIRKTTKLGKIVLVVLIVVIIVVFTQGLYDILSGSYIKDKSHFFKLDSITLLNQAYTSGGRHGGTSLHFEDTNRYRFVVDNFVYNSILNRGFLRDTLKYHGIKLIVYTDKDGYETYVRELKNKTVDIYQLEIGNMQYVDLENANQLRKRGLIFRVSILTIVLIGIVSSYWKLR